MMQVTLIDGLSEHNLDNSGRASSFGSLPYLKGCYKDKLSETIESFGYQTSYCEEGSKIDLSKSGLYVFLRAGISQKGIKDFLQRTKYLSINSRWLFNDGDTAILLVSNDTLVSHYSLPLPKDMFDLDSLVDYEKFIASVQDTRFINQINYENGLYVKRSLDKIKLRSEFEFLNSLPDTQKSFYITVMKWQERENMASYQMPKIPAENLAELFRLDLLSEDEIELIFSQIASVFSSSSVDSRGYSFSTVEWIVEKTRSRLLELKSHESYASLHDSFIRIVDRTIDDLAASIFNCLENRKEIIDNYNYYYAHGDLCLSNILFDQSSRQITLIDPRGLFRLESPFFSCIYDAAKLSHSILGGYDMFVEGNVDITLNSFDIGLHVPKYSSQAILEGAFFDFLQAQKLDIYDVRLVEASLFISMLPLHIEDDRKLLLLLLNAERVFSSL